MILPDYSNLIKEIDLTIPVYTDSLEMYKKFIDVINQKKLSHIEEYSKTDIEQIEYFTKIYSFSSLICISTLDLMVITKHLCLIKYKWESFYLLKNGYLTIYETISKILSKKDGVSFYRIIELKYPSGLENYKLLLKDVELFKETQEFESYIKIIRNKIAGHIDNDYTLYYNLISSLDSEKAINTVIAFNEILKNYNIFLKKLRKIIESQLAI